MSDTSTSNAVKAEGQLVAANDQAGGGPSENNGVVLTGGTLTDVTAEALKETLQAAGYRVDVFAANGAAVLRSATSGFPFEIRLANALAGDGYADVTFVALFAVNGVFPHELLNQWNKSHRFARLFLDRPDAANEFLVLCLDLSLVGGVSHDHLRTQIVIWDALVQQLVAWLRQELPKVSPASASDASIETRA